MIRIFLCALLSVFTVTGYAQAVPSEELLNGLLKDHVREGRVNYKALREDSRLQEYLKQAASTDPQQLKTRNERLAFWINVYNAATLKIICDHYPVKSINDLSFGGLYVGTLVKKTVWDRPFVVVNRRLLTLNTIEHKIIRKSFREPRAHFALVCASKSCAPLRNQAYNADVLDFQLDDQGRIFLAQKDKNYFDAGNKVAYLSPVFSWFAADFGATPSRVLMFLTKFLPAPIARDIRANPASWSIRYTAYDWRLNE